MISASIFYSCILYKDFIIYLIISILDDWLWFRIVGHRSSHLHFDHQRSSFIQYRKTKKYTRSIRGMKKIKWKTIIIFAVLNATFHTSITFGYICMCVFVARCLPLRLNIEYSRNCHATRLIHLISLIQIRART